MKSILLALLAITIVSSTAIATTNTHTTVTSSFEDPNNLYSDMGRKFDEQKQKSDCALRADGKAASTQLSLNGTRKGTTVVDRDGNASL